MSPDFSKYPDGLIPAIIQDVNTNKVLMLGFMNAESLEKTQKEKVVTFFSRAKQRLWIKGETSGNKMIVNEVMIDCDSDTLLIKAEPTGPVCHTGMDTCFREVNRGFSLNKLEAIIADRKKSPSEKSYTSSLFTAGINKIAQKLGEEAVELVIEAKDNDDEKFLNEAADLVYHFLVLLQAKNFTLEDVAEKLRDRSVK